MSPRRAPSSNAGCSGPADENGQRGIIGCGKILGAYAGGCGGLNFFKVVACADAHRAAAEAKAKEFNVPRVCSVEGLLADPSIEIVINLTVPQAHAKLNLAALDILVLS